MKPFDLQKKHFSSPGEVGYFAARAAYLIQPVHHRNGDDAFPGNFYLSSDCPTFAPPALRFLLGVAGRNG